jgi:hypothetical protein
MFNYYRATATGKVKRDAEYYGLKNAYYEMKILKMVLKLYKKAFEENGSNYKAKFQLAKAIDDLYKDKKMGYKHYKKYKDLFLDSDKVMTTYILKRILDIKKEYFMKGEKLEQSVH